MQIALSILGGSGLGTARRSAERHAYEARRFEKRHQERVAVQHAPLLIDAGALAIVFLMRAVIPMDFSAAIIATAAAMSIFTIVFTFRIARPDGKSEENKPE